MIKARRATIYDVAAQAHVSAQTVSRVVNAAAGVAPATRERVQIAIRELGYQPDTAARALKSGRSQRIGVLSHQMTATGPSGNTAAALAELRAAGYDLDIVALPEDTDEEMTHLLVGQAMAGFARSACAVMAMAQTEAVRAAVLAAGLQVPVYLDAYLDRGSPTAPGAEELVGRAAAAHLLSLGHRVLAHLPGPKGSLSGRYRQESFQEAIRGAGATCEIWPAGDWSATSGHHVASRTEVGAATALFVSNDAMAIGALSALQARGIAVPTDLAVMGTDDIPESAYTSPALTSVHHDTAAEGRLAARVLLADLHGLPHPDTAEALQVQVRARASTIGESRDR